MSTLSQIDIEIAIQAKMIEIQKKRDLEMMEEYIQKEATKRLAYSSAKTYGELYEAVIMYEDNPRLCPSLNDREKRKKLLEWAKDVSKEIFAKRTVSHDLLMLYETDQAVSAGDWDLLRILDIQGNPHASKHLVRKEMMEEKLRAEKEEKERDDKICEAIKFAFFSYYSSRHSSEYPDNWHNPQAKRMCRDQFKANQKILHDMGITTESINLPQYNKAYCAIHGTGRSTPQKMKDIAFLLTATKTHADQFREYTRTGLPAPPTYRG